MYIHRYYYSIPNELTMNETLSEAEDTEINVLLMSSDRTTRSADISAKCMSPSSPARNGRQCSRRKESSSSSTLTVSNEA